MNESSAQPASWRRLILRVLVVVAVIGVLAFLTIREAGYRAALGRDIAMSKEVDLALRVYYQEQGRYPASLAEPDFQPYIDASAVAFLREGRLTYHPPAADSPPNFIIVHLTTPRGDYSFQLDDRLIVSPPQPSFFSPPKIAR